MKLIFFNILLFFPAFLQGQILPQRPATALNKVILYPDSTFFTHSNTYYEEGTLFEVMSESRLEHEDEAQNQKFKWYQVKTPDEKVGWIYGDGIAVILPKSEVTPLLESYHLRQFKFSDEIKEAVTWLASIEGKDNFHKEDYLNPLYKEYYLVLTSNLGKSFHIHVGGESTMGSSELRDFMVKDLTEDNIPEMLLLKSNFDSGSPVEHRQLEIFTLQAGSLNKVFEEEMSLTYQDKEPSPALFKFVEISRGNIRIAYIDYLDCHQHQLALQPNMTEPLQGKCLEYVTYSFVWDKQQKKYVSIYEENRTAVVGRLRPEKGFLRAEPSYLSEVNERLPANASLKIIQHYEKPIHLRGEKKIVPYFYVRSEKGNYGYIHAKDISIEKSEHLSVLNNYYANPPKFKKNWQSDSSFLIISLNDNKQVILTKND